MDEHTVASELDRIGDRLEAAVAAAIESGNNAGAPRHDMDDPTPTEVSMSRSLKPRRTRRGLVFVGGIGGLVLAGTGVAAAFGAFAADEVAHGMPGGSAIFVGTDPTCTTTDDVVFECTLARPPAGGDIDTTPPPTGPGEQQLDGPPAEAEELEASSANEPAQSEAPEGEPSASPESVEVDHTGSNQLYVDADQKIAGACVGQDAEGLHWTCYAGERAVEEGLLVADLLGNHLSGPVHG